MADIDGYYWWLILMVITDDYYGIVGYYWLLILMANIDWWLLLIVGIVAYCPPLLMVNIDLQPSIDGLFICIQQQWLILAARIHMHVLHVPKQIPSMALLWETHQPALCLVMACTFWQWSTIVHPLPSNLWLVLSNGLHIWKMVKKLSIMINFGWEW